MPQFEPVVTIALLLAAALVGGMIAHRLRQPVILGYIIIGVVVGPHAVGVVQDLELIEAAATIGVALLMFTLGLEISIAQLREVGRVGIWGGIAQIMGTFMLGMIVGILLFQWSPVQAVLFGLIISLSSTAVSLKILMERGELSSVQGRIMIAFLILQDISVVLMMVVLPLMGKTAVNIPLTLASSLGKALLFIGIGIVMGRWVLPWLMGRVGGIRTRELFLLTVLVLSLGAAIATQLFGLSIVFGAFLVGLVLRETRFVHQALAEITPLRDIFAALFFVSLGMLLDPVFLLGNWVPVLTVVAVIVFLKFLVVFAIVRLFGFSNRIAVLAGAGLFQIGEFGFILAQGGVNMGIASEYFYSLMLSSAIITMLLTPILLTLVSRIYSRSRRRKVHTESVADVTLPSSETEKVKSLSRVVVAGYGRVGRNVAQGLHDAEIPYLVIDIDPERVAEARASSRPRIYGDATNLNVLYQVDLSRTKVLVITYPDPMAVVTTAKLALSINPKLKILARFHRLKESDELKELGVKELISPEYEASFRFIKRILNIMGLESAERRRILAMLRKDEEFL
ncbi:cation:proton antiporter [Chloroflexota bacterium]